MTDLKGDILDPTRLRIFNDLKAVTIGRVGTFARATGRAVVDLLMSGVSSDGRIKPRNPSPQAVVCLPAGDGYAVAFDVVADDPGIVLAADSPWDQAWRTGDRAVPTSGQRHTYGSAAFIPGGRLGGVEAANSKGSMRVGAADGSASIDFSRKRAAPVSLGVVTVRADSAVAGVKLGSPAAGQGVALGPLVKAASATGWSTFITTIEANPAIPETTADGIIAAATAAAAAEAALTVASAKVVADA